MGISNLKSKKEKFYNILNISFDSKYKKKLNVTITFMLFGIILELFGIGLIFPALKLVTDQEFLKKTYEFLGVSNVKVSTLLTLITLFFIFFYGFKNFFLWLVPLFNIIF